MGLQTKSSYPHCVGISICPTLARIVFCHTAPSSSIQTAKWVKQASFLFEIGLHSQYQLHRNSRNSSKSRINARALLPCLPPLSLHRDDCRLPRLHCITQSTHRVSAFYGPFSPCRPHTQCVETCFDTSPSSLVAVLFWSTKIDEPQARHSDQGIMRHWLQEETV